MNTNQPTQPQGHPTGNPEPSISFLLNSSINSVVSHPAPPQPVEFLTPGDGEWDAILTGFDWTENNWHDYIALNQIPWDKLSQDTVDLLAKQWSRYDRQNLPSTFSQSSNPASLEQLRRFWAYTERNSVQTGEAMRYFDHGADPFRADDITDDYGEPTTVTADEPDNETIADEFYTIGYEIEFLQAVATVGKDPVGGGDDSGSEDGRWLDEFLGSTSNNSIVYTDAVQRRVARELNNHAGVVCLVKDEEDDADIYDDRFASIEQRINANDPTGSQTNPNNDTMIPENIEEAVDVFVSHAQSTFLSMPEGKAIHEASIVDITRYVDEVVMQNDEVKALGAAHQNEFRQRLINHLEVTVHLSQRDPLAVELPGMKHRYRSWSVSYVPRLLPDAVPTQFYAGVADPSLPSPYTQYRWQVTKVSSPVLSGEQVVPVHEALSRVCGVLRERFRIHKDLPSQVPASAQVTLSHTRGYTLLELKRLATLVRLVEPELRRLHRRERADPSGWRACASVATWSALGGAASEPYARVSARPWHKAWRTLPCPHAVTRAELLLRMEANLPVAELFAPRGGGGGDDGLAEEVFYRGVWLCTSVEQLSRVMASGSPGVRTAVVFKCLGKGKRTRDDRTAEDEARDPLPFSVADRRRGAVEFRHMQHTLEPWHMICWTAVCARMVSAAKDSTADQFRRLVLDILRGQPILDKLRVPDEFQEGFLTGINRGVAQGQGPFFMPAKTDVEYDDPFWKKP